MGRRRIRPIAYCRSCGVRTSHPHSPMCRPCYRAQRVREANVSFWAGLDRSGDCWIWTRERYPSGYGVLTRAGLRVKAHRLAWELTYGPTPDGLLVLHHCDNPPCVRPAHLFLGTQADNVRDMDAKGRRRNQHQVAA